MVQIIKLIALFLWLPQAIAHLFTWIYWWQVKEYRFDRFWVFLRTWEGKEKLGFKKIFIKFLGLVFGYINLYIPLIIFFLQDLVLIKTIFRKQVRKPVVTERIKKIWLICYLGIIITSLSLYFSSYKVIYILFFGEVLLIITPYLGILGTIPIVNKIKCEEIKKAKKIISSVKPTVIAITGSYGKTTTKDFIAHLLSQKYKTAKTEGSENTEFGIARKTLKNVKKETKFFVVEMGAYKRGEIARLAMIVKPYVGIITGIEPQHVSLFRSIENIKKAKFELIESLPKEGIALFNVTNRTVKELQLRAKKLDKDLQIFSYAVGVGKNIEKNVNFISRIVNADVQGIIFEISNGEESRKFTTTLPGIHFIENLSGAICVARLFGLSWREIENGISTLTTPEHTMRVLQLDKGNVIIDDTYNSTPKGFESAINYLNLFESKNKIIVTPGIIELGGYSDNVHQNLGKIMNDNINRIILLNKEPFDSIKAAIQQKDKVKLLKNPNKLIKEFVDLKETVILLEGRIPKKLSDVFINNLSLNK